MGYTESMKLDPTFIDTPGVGSCASTTAGKKQRIPFLLAGAFTVTGTVLAVSVNLWFALIPVVVGANQLLMSAVGWCPMSKLLDRILPNATI